MKRNYEIPLVLWICAAICVHLLFATGSDQAASQLRKQRDDLEYIEQLASRTRERIRPSESSIEIEAAPASPSPTQPEAELPTPRTRETQKPRAPLPKQPDPPTAATPAPAKTPLQLKPEPEDPLKKLDEQPPPAASDNRVAVRQRVKPNQADNPNARFIGDEANKVAEEQVATQTSHDQDDEQPTPGASSNRGPRDRMGDSDQTRIAQSEAAAGSSDRAPGSKPTQFDFTPATPSPTPAVRSESSSAPASANTPATAASTGPGQPNPSVASNSAQTPPSVGSPSSAPTAPPSAPPATTADSTAAPAPAEPATAADATGSSWFVPVRPPSKNANTKPGSNATGMQKPSGSSAQNPTQWLGINAGATAGQVNLNLSSNSIASVVGADQLRREREADGERRKSEHRGAWTASPLERWKSAIENYVSSVKPGNTTALNTAAAPFASYLNGIHNRIHPLFAESFLASLDALPKNHPLNAPKLVSKLEIVVNPKEGRIVKIGIVQSSGITAFDVAALDSLSRAQPFGAAPSAIVSPDGNVYLHWEFHRNEVFACSTMHARPFMLAGAPTPIGGNPRTKGDRDERPEKNNGALPNDSPPAPVPSPQSPPRPVAPPGPPPRSTSETLHG